MELTKRTQSVAVDVGLVTFTVFPGNNKGNQCHRDIALSITGIT